MAQKQKPAIHMILPLWSVLWALALPFLLFYIKKRARKDPGYKAKLPERFGFYSRSPFIQNMKGAVWIHAVSLGEMRSATPLIKEILARNGRVITTHFTPTGRREAEKVFAAEIAAGQMYVVWVPFEFAFSWNSFFKTFRPVCGLSMEVEIWPRMIFASEAKDVPLFMCNAQYHTAAMARDAKVWSLGIRHSLMRGFAGALVKSDIQAQRFASIGVKNIVTTGELRFDQPISPHFVKAGKLARKWFDDALSLKGKKLKVIAIASSIEGEDPTYLHMIEELRKKANEAKAPPPLFIYIPRRPERFDSVAQTLLSAGLNLARRSTLFDEELNPRIAKCETLPDVVLGDSIGEMYFYLSMCDITVVGGGFSPKGAHNIIESLSLGKPVITGPYTQTIEYPLIEASEAGVALRVLDPSELINALSGSLSPSQESIKTFFDNHSGATQKTIAALRKMVGANFLSNRG